VAISNKWQLFHLAAALTRAKRLEAQREAFHEELYDCIVYSRVHYDREITGGGVSPATDVQAIKIIESKERYERLIQNEYDRSVRWRVILSGLKGNDRLVAIRYFEKKKFVQPSIINRLVRKMGNQIEREERTIEKERNVHAAEAYTAYQDRTEAFRVTLPPTKSYLISGDFKKLSESQYEEYKRRTGKVADFII